MRTQGTSVDQFPLLISAHQGNVLISDGEGRVRALLCDFGLAKIEEADPSGFTTSSWNRAGSPRYMSPELCETPSRTEASDMWAWGCILLEVSPYHPWLDRHQVHLIGR